MESMKNPQKTVKKITKKMPLFDISQFEQLLWQNYLSYVHQILHASSQGPYPSLPAKKAHLCNYWEYFLALKC